jgi:hypothetical protein
MAALDSEKVKAALKDKMGRIEESSTTTPDMFSWNRTQSCAARKSLTDPNPPSAMP